MVYIDTSVLVAYYCPEKISEKIEAILIAIDKPAISQLTEVELASALSRKIRENELSHKDGRTILDLFKFHIEDNSYTFLPIQPKHFSIAMNWISQFSTPLRTLDALHLAIAASNQLPLLTADVKFADSAKILNIDVNLIF